MLADLKGARGEQVGSAGFRWGLGKNYIEGTFFALKPGAKFRENLVDISRKRALRPGAGYAPSTGDAGKGDRG